LREECPETEPLEPPLPANVIPFRPRVTR